MAKAAVRSEPFRLDSPGVPKLGLVPLDVLAQLGNSTNEGLARPVLSAATVAAPPPTIVVVAATPGADGVVPDDVGIAVAGENRIDLMRRLRRADATGKPGEATVIELEDDTTEQLVVLGLGDGSARSARQAGSALAGCIQNAERVLCAVTASLSQEAMRALCEGLLLASYRFSLKSSPGQREQSAPFVQLVVAGVATAQPVLDLAVSTARSVALARDLANTPSNRKNPGWLSKRAEEIASEAGLKYTGMDQQRLEREGFGGILSVGAGSAHPPCLIMLEYRSEAAAPHIVLIGKAITFDSGGLSIKPADSMPMMKTDMAGAAAVLGVMRGLAYLAVPVRVTALLPSAENMLGAAAYRPSDVVTHFGGRTTEVRNTDAEGRLVLADALAYADLVLRPDAIIDVATLTGAATVALGRRYAALYSNDERLSKRLRDAGDAGNDPLWRMPLAHEYLPELDSPIADISQIAAGNPGAGSILGALFLEKFVGNRKWAHLDIAGSARAEKKVEEATRGATGFGTRVLLRWLERAPDLW